MDGLDFIALGLLVLLLLPIVLIDLRESRIPNICNLALGVCGLALALVRNPTLQTLGFSLGAAVVTFVLLAGTAWLMQKIDRNARIGWGDLKFLTAASLWVGVQGSLIVLILASLVALVATLALAPWRGGVKWREMRPFGPALAVGLIAVTVTAFIRGA
ncbi:MAG: prepilin peptidase [Inquilinus limosus]|uniref:Prepilin peptidase n=1 Tax=Inquilinus limosus TaxID=171674 RepID=A0A952KDR1_9PROT|nr:prepilin peptidase [Inquilinus limosus]